MPCGVLPGKTKGNRSKRNLNSQQGLSMQLPATPEAVAEVRREVEARALELGISEKSLYDLKTVVSEACTNVVRYAYEEDPGPLEVELNPHGQSLKVLVRDRGCGIAPKVDTDPPSLHMGLPLIGALSTRFVLSSERGVGTELEIHVPLEPHPPAAGVIEA
jgi:anti-sigma regulatory factor (Ser/Thr protein kinase)